MKKTIQSLIIAALIGGSAQFSAAQERGEMLERLFSRMDQNKDGLIEESEAPAEFWSRMSSADADKDGKIDKTEAAQGMKAMGGRRGQSPRGPGAPGAKEENDNKGRPTDKDSAATGQPGNGDRARQLMDRVQKMMKTLDKDGDGKVAIDDIPGDFKERLAKLDKNNDGMLEKSEMAELRNMLADGNGDPAGGMIERMQKLFSQYDKDGDGKVVLDELPEMARERLTKLDANNDGMIEKSELKGLLNGEKRPEGKGEGKLGEGRYGIGSESTAPQSPKRPDSDGL